MLRRAQAVALVLLAAAGSVATARAQHASTLVVGAFSSSSPGGTWPAEWQPLTFEKIARHTVYQIVEDADAVVIRASSQSAASGLIRRIRIDPNEYPIVQWRWKVAGVVDKGDVTRKAGDDYAARLYVTFEFDPQRAGLVEAAKFRAARVLFGAETPYRALNYIWESRAPQGNIVPNPYTDRTMMIVVRSGSAEAGRWIVEERDVLEDYRKAFGTDPPKISGIAIMTDTDNTQTSATAWYGDIVFKKAAGR